VIAGRSDCHEFTGMFQSTPSSRSTAWTSASLSERRNTMMCPTAPLNPVPATLRPPIAIAIAVVFAGGPFGGYVGVSNTVWARTSVGLLVLATLWVAFVGRGPLERLVARVSRPRAEG